MNADILLFGGQGLANLSSSTTPGVRSSSTSTAAKDFLSACHEAFLTEFEALSAEQKTIAAKAADLCFEGPESLLLPPESLHSNAVIQSTNLYLQQILSFISYTLSLSPGSDRARSQDRNPEFAEVAGFCSGVISAIVSSCYNGALDQSFLTTAVDGFRLSFWIGIRSAEFCRDNATNPTDSTPWSLTVFGLSASDVSRAITEFNQTHQPRVPLRVSTILHKRTISVAGEGSSLATFQIQHLHPVRSSFVNVHGYYHGGSLMEPSLSKVLEDVRRRGIQFPSWDDLKARVRFMTDSPDGRPRDKSGSLLKVTLRMILVEQISWDAVAKQLLSALRRDMESGITARCRILAMKPNSRPLLRTMRDEPPDNRLDIREFSPPAAAAASNNDIAIVGMSTNFPSGKGQDQLWNTLERGLNVVQEIPGTRFEVSQYYQSDAKKGTKSRNMDTKYGNFLDDPFSFDNAFFSISPREARSMDPQQRILLHAAFEALQDAGYVPDATSSFQTESFGVYVGVATLDYVDNTRDDIDVYYSPGTLRAFLSGRISYAFQFKGPSVVIDTACSSSTVSIYQACRALQAGDCAAALAGGVNVISSPDMYLGLNRAHFLSKTGQCKPFDTSADGYCRAEGCGMFVLKRLSDAVAENDHIYGVIKGIEVNQCGTAKSITHPDADTQTVLIQKLLKKINVPAASISVVEAHGTGTQAGDYAEACSLTAALCQSRTPDNRLIVSSIKGNLGHAEAASGAAGLAKLLLMLKNKSIPPQASFHELNPRLDILNQHGVQIPQTLRPWPSTAQHPRRALLNNFGAAGSNVALIVEEFIGSACAVSDVHRSAHILNLSAKTSDALENLRKGYAQLIAETPDGLGLSDLCYSTTARRQCFDQYRISVTGRSLADLRSKLIETKVSAGTADTKKRTLVFVFSGQGSVYSGMGHELFSTVPTFAQDVLTCDRTLVALGFPSIRRMICEDQKTNSDATDSTDGAQIIAQQCACFVLEYALARLWLTWGVHPDILVGHSIGEYAALTIAGSLSLQDALFLVGKRAELMVELCPTNCSGMLASNLSAAAANHFLSKNDLKDISVSCKNSPEHSVVAGPLKSLQEFEELARGAGHKVKMLDTPYGFHSPFMDPIEEEFAAIAATIRTSVPNIPVVSSYLGRLIETIDLCSSHFVCHARHPVEFENAAKSLERAIGAETATLIEIGPAPSTLPLLKASMTETTHSYIPSLRPAEKSWVTMTAALESLFLHRQHIQWRAVYDGTGARFVPDMMKYPLNASQYVVPFKERMSSISPEAAQPPVSGSLHKFARSGRIQRTKVGTSLDLDIAVLAPLIQAHKVGGLPLCPASVYIELALETIDVQTPFGNGTYCVLRDIEFSSPLVHGQATKQRVSTIFDSLTNSFRVTSAEKDQHCVGSLETEGLEAVDRIFARKASFINRQIESVQFTDTFTARILYETVFTRVVTYSQPFLTLQYIKIAASGLEGYGTLEIDQTEQKGFLCPPSFTDTMLHAAGFVANSKIGSEEACICVKVERVTIPIGTSQIYEQQLSVYCSLLDCSDGHLIGDAYMIDSTGKVVASVEGMHFKRLRLKAFSAHLARSHRPATLSLRTKSEPLMTSVRAISEASAATTLDGAIVKTKGEKFSNGGNLSQPAITTSSVQVVLHSTLSQVCGISGPIDVACALSDLGVDSLLLIELASSLQEQFPWRGLSKSDFERCGSLLDMQNLIMGRSVEERHALDHTDHSLASMDRPMDTEAPMSTGSRQTDMQTINEFIQDVSGISLAAAGKDTRLCHLGIDSLLSIELTAGLRQQFNIQMDEDLDISDLHVRDFEQLLLGNSVSDSQSALSKNDRQGSHEPLAPLNTYDRFPSRLESCKGSSTPLYLLHDGSGLCNMYSRLSEMGRNMFGLFSLDFQSLNKSICTMQQLAALYIKESKMTASSEVILGGWSFGGVLAFEMSRQLREHGIHVKGVILIDSPHPVSHDPLPAEIISYISASMPARTKAGEQMKESIEAQFQRNASLLANYNPLPNDSDDTILCVMLKCKQTFDSVSICGVAYPWVCDETSRQQSVKVWESLLGKPITVLDVDGDHFNLFNPQNVGDVSLQLRKACDML